MKKSVLIKFPEVKHGGKRQGAGHKPCDSVRLEFSIPRPIYNELARREAVSGIYRTRIAATILCEELIGGIVDRELSFYGRVDKRPKSLRS